MSRHTAVPPDTAGGHSWDYRSLRVRGQRRKVPCGKLSRTWHGKRAREAEARVCRRWVAVELRRGGGGGERDGGGSTVKLIERAEDRFGSCKHRPRSRDHERPRLVSRVARTVASLARPVNFCFSEHLRAGRPDLGGD